MLLHIIYLQNDNNGIETYPKNKSMGKLPDNNGIWKQTEMITTVFRNYPIITVLRNNLKIKVFRYKRLITVLGSNLLITVLRNKPLITVFTTKLAITKGIY